VSTTILERGDAVEISNRTEDYYAASFSRRAAWVDRMMVWLLGAEWLGLIGTAAIVSPLVWTGSRSGLHPHLLAAIAAGPAFILPVIGIALLCPAKALTRQAIAIAQILVSSLLIDATGGRIETHFHLFGSLAFLALYRDPRVLITASLLTAADHFFRGIWWPQSVYGILTASPWRWVEHAWWVVFEDIFLLLSMKTSIFEARLIANNKATLYHGANHDFLTGLANRRLLQAKFDFAVAQENSTSALIFVDLDRFKQANDTLGHTVGDCLLVLVAERFAAVVGGSGTLARVGGDEFVIFLDSCTDPKEAKLVGQKVVECLAAPFRAGEHELLLSASVGISFSPDHGTTLVALQEKADQAMYLAKSQGRNQCVAFSPAVSRRADMVQEIGKDLSAAMANGQFQLYYQPLITRDGHVAGFEALLRWKHPRNGVIAPADFIPQAEKSGLIIALGDWVLTEACRFCRTWQRPDQPPTGIAVNVSIVQFDQADYPERVFAVLAKTGIDPSLLTLELTEGVLIRDPARARAHLTRIRLAGVRIALDDFGTGYSSLSYLTDLPADLIKLDRTFVNRESPDALLVVESVVKLAHRLGLKVVAEGVETSAQNKGLMDAMCDEFQGYYFSHPISAGEVSKLLECKLASEQNTLASVG
jgi:diguanylate cyclase (GGDEF)-like protein